MYKYKINKDLNTIITKKIKFVKYKVCFSTIIFPKNPKNGGKPAKENIVNKINIL